MADIYVSPTGSDITGDGSSGNPYQTLNYVITNIVSDNDVIICKDGVYTEVTSTILYNITIKSEANNFASVTIEYTDSNSANALFIIADGTIDKKLILKDITLSALDVAPLIIIPISENSYGSLELIRCYLKGNGVSEYGVYSTYNTDIKSYKTTYRGFILEALYCNGTPTDIQDCIFEGNNIAIPYYNSFGINGDYNCFYNSSTYHYESGTLGAHDITSNPDFLNASSAEINNTSPCVNAGIVILGYVETYINNAPDIGVFEVEDAIIQGINEIILEASSQNLRAYAVQDTNIVEFDTTQEIFPTPKIEDIVSLELISSSTNSPIRRQLQIFSYGMDVRTGEYTAYSISYGIDIRSGEQINNNYGIDVRCATSINALFKPKTILDFHIFLDGVELDDIDIESGRIVYNTGSTPSTFSIKLARRHDKFDYKLNGTFSELSNENKITVYDGSILLYTGYITKIDLDGSADTIVISAEDIRYKINRLSPSKFYYGYYLYNEKQRILTEESLQVYDTSKQAIQFLLDDLVSNSLLTGYDSSILEDFDLKVQGNSQTDTHLNLINNLITEIGTYSFYIDENEYLHFYKIGVNQSKILSLASFDERRNITHIIDDNITMNRTQSDYTKGLRVIHGNKHTLDYIHETYNLIDENNRVKDLLRQIEASKYAYSVFMFQKWTDPPSSYDDTELLDTGFYFDGSPFSLFKNNTYIGENVSNSSYWVAGYGYVVKAIGLYQVQTKDIYENIPDSYIGISTNAKTIDFTNFSQEDTTYYYEHRNVEDRGWLYKIIPQRYNFLPYAIELATLDLYRRNKLVTEGNIRILLDAIEFYGIKLKDAINIDNTIEDNIYNNNNGFPLNVESMSVSLGDRIVAISLSNKGTTFYKRTLGYDKSIETEYQEIPIVKQVSRVTFSQGL